jgi:hypothetical protein
MIIERSIRDFLLELQKDKRIFLEGNILKVLEAENGDEEFSSYLNEAIEKDRTARRKRLEITKQVQSQNSDLLNWKGENEHLTNNLKDALARSEESAREAEQSREEAINSKEEAVRAKEEADNARREAERAKDVALNDLDVIQKKSQTELIGTIVKVALIVIISIGVITTGMYCLSIFTGKETQIIGSTWANMFGILLTNAFSIVGTIMGVKYASESNKSE